MSTMSIRRSAAAVQEYELAKWEAELGFALPEDYRAFLLQSNGGVPRGTQFDYVNAKSVSRRTQLRWLYSLGSEGTVEVEFPDLRMARADRSQGLPEGVIPIGEVAFDVNTGQLCLGCVGERTGKLFLRPDGSGEKTTLFSVAPSLTEFLQSLKYAEKPKPWMELVWNRDEAGFRQWLTETQK